MRYRVEVSPAAQKEIRELSGYVRAQALTLLHTLAENPHLPRAKQFRNKPTIYRIWLARNWRIAYSVDDERNQVLVLRVRRKEQIDYESL